MRQRPLFLVFLGNCLFFSHLVLAGSSTDIDIDEIQDDEPYAESESSCSSVLSSDTVSMKSFDSALTGRQTYTTLIPFPGYSKKARLRPLIILIPGGLGLSDQALEKLKIIRRKFDLVFALPPGVISSVPNANNVTTPPEFFKEELGSVFPKIVGDFGLSFFQKLTTTRPIVLVGYSYGATAVAEIVAKHYPDLLPNIRGLVLMGGAHTSDTIRETSRNRRKALNKLPDYQKYKERLFFRTAETWREKIIERLEQKKEPITEKKIQDSIELNDRHSLVGFILAQASLLWNPEENEMAQDLIRNDLFYCSPDCMRYAQKVWSEDKEENNWTQSQLAKFKKIKKLSFIGENDLYYNKDLLIKEAKAIEADIHIFQNGSHFFPITYAEKILEILYNEFG